MGRLYILCRSMHGNKGEKSYDGHSRGNAHEWLGLRAVQDRVGTNPCSASRSNFSSTRRERIKIPRFLKKVVSHAYKVI